MDVLVIGDTHFKVNNVDETELMVNEIINVAKQKNPKFIVCLGDTLDRFESINVYPLMRAINFFKELVNIAPLYIIIGNHDRPSNNVFLTDEHPFNSLKEWKNTYIIDKPLKKYIDDLYFLFVPYVPPKRFNEAIGDIENYNAIFCHQEFYGCNLGKTKSVSGDVWNEEYPLIISGHIHTYHQPQKNIIYVGSPIADQIRSVSLFTFTKDNYMYERIKIKYIKNNVIYINIDNIDNIDKIDENAKIVLSGTNEEINVMKKNKKLKGRNIKYKYTMSNKDIKCNIPFIERVYDQIKDNEELLKILEECHGRIN